MDLFTLPPELVAEICSHLEAPDIGALSMTCRRARLILNTTVLGQLLVDCYGVSRANLDSASDWRQLYWQLELVIDHPPLINHHSFPITAVHLEAIMANCYLNPLLCQELRSAAVKANQLDIFKQLMTPISNQYYNEWQDLLTLACQDGRLDFVEYFATCMSAQQYVEIALSGGTTEVIDLALRLHPLPANFDWNTVKIRSVERAELLIKQGFDATILLRVMVEHSLTKGVGTYLLSQGAVREWNAVDFANIAEVGDGELWQIVKPPLKELPNLPDLLRKACRGGSLQIVEDIVTAAGGFVVDPNICLAPTLEMLQYLQGQGMKIGSPGTYSQVPSLPIQLTPEYVRYLHAHGYDLNGEIDMYHDPVITPLGYLSEEDQMLPVLQTMIELGAAINFPAGRSGVMAPLIAAAWFDQLTLVEFLLDHGADIDYYDRYSDETALSCARDYRGMHLLLSRGATPRYGRLLIVESINANDYYMLQLMTRYGISHDEHQSIMSKFTPQTDPKIVELITNYQPIDIPSLKPVE